jgi:RimJ/RimL family protein N-acetyltransferase
MPLHSGAHYELEGVRIGPPEVEVIARAPRDADVARSVERWLSRAQRQDDIHYFSVYEGAALVGQIFLHDIDAARGEALVGYHLFERRFRGRGIGTKMLTLLQRYVCGETSLRRLVAITGDDNMASQRIALKCGFIHTGPPREDPVHGMCFEWLAEPGACATIADAQPQP